MYPRPGFKKTVFCRLTLILILAVLTGGCGFFGPSSNLGPTAAQNARKYVGVPYQPGGKSPGGFDCSGLTYYVYHRLGLELPRSSAQQAGVGRRISRRQLQPGDLVFFKTGAGRGVTHVGLYLGRQKFVHAPGRGKNVIISELDSEYYAKRYHSARRVS